MARPTRAVIAAWPDKAAMKSGMGDTSDFIAGLLGGKPVEELTISGGAVSAESTIAGDSGPTAVPHFTVDTESDAAADDLTTVTVDEFEDGQFLLLGLENANRPVTLKHENGGAGQLSLASGGDVVLSRTTQWVLFYVDKSGTAALRERMRGGFSLAAYGSLTVEDNATATAIAALSTDFSNAVQVEVFGANGVASGVTPDHTNDHLTVADAGVYDIEAHVSFAGGGNDTISLAFFKNNGADQLGARVTRKIGSGGDVGATGITATVALEAGDTVELWVQNETSTADVVVQDACMKISSK